MVSVFPMRPRFLLPWLAAGIWPAALCAGEPAVDLKPLVPETAAPLAKAGPSRGGDLMFYLPTHDKPATPATWGFRFEPVDFESTDGTKLRGWFLPARGERLGTVVFSHGNAGSVGHHLGFILWLVEAGYQVLTFDYRGYGESAGSPDRRGMVEDVKSAFRYASARNDVDPTRLVSYGHSLGGAKSVAALGETRIPGLRAVVVDGTFASYRAMARQVAGRLGESLVTDDLAPEKLIARISPVPLLVIHGGNDPVVPISQGRRLFDAAHEPKTFFEVRSGGHGDSLARDHGAYRKRLLDWLAGSLGG